MAHLLGAQGCGVSISTDCGWCQYEWTRSDVKKQNNQYTVYNRLVRVNYTIMISV